MRALALALCISGLVAACDAAPETSFIPPTRVIAVDTPPPEYPLEVACEGVGGKVQLFVTIGTEGTVTGAQMRQTSGQPLLDAAALEAVRDWRFRPATANGQPVETGIQVPITFNVPDEEPADCYFQRYGTEPPAAS